MTERLRILIVDDEPACRDDIRDLLATEADCTVIAEAGDGPSALAAIREHQPDIVFLDIQMPELDGFGVLEGIDERTRTAFIFVTAYEQYAIRAFEAHALDYLLKPFDRERFERSLQRAREAAQVGAAVSDDVQGLIREIRSQSDRLERFVVRAGHRILLIPVDHIDCIEAAGNYVHLHGFDGSDHLLRASVSALETRLDPERFVRVHRSTIVRIAAISELEKLGSGDHLIRLQSGRETNLSRTYRKAFEAGIGHGL